MHVPWRAETTGREAKMTKRSLVRLSALLLLIVGAYALAACGDSDDSGESGAQGADTLLISAQFMSESIDAGQHTLTIHVSDLDGSAVEGATVTVDPQMPSHGHGSSETPVITELGDGTYQADNVTFQMPGPWEVTIEATKGELSGSLLMDIDVN